ncbi:MAG TPA: hypothetical protein VIM81_14810 [Gammaproteobacteria bacterium]
MPSMQNQADRQPLWKRAAMAKGKRRAPLASLALLLGLPFAVTPGAADERHSASADGERSTVLNPTGTPPAIERRPLAERPASLDGKTVYLVDVTFNGGDLLLREMQEWFAAHMPGVKTEYRAKQGAYFADDPALWAEIKAAGGLMIMAIGH